MFWLTGTFFTLTLAFKDSLFQKTLLGLFSVSFVNCGNTQNRNTQNRKLVVEHA